jgi:hypothetical protein
MMLYNVSESLVNGSFPVAAPYPFPEQNNRFPKHKAAHFNVSLHYRRLMIFIDLHNA